VRRLSLDSVETEASTEDAIAARGAATERKSQEQITQACGEITKKNKKEDEDNVATWPPRWQRGLERPYWVRFLAL
jgi:hypothetical protein